MEGNKLIWKSPGRRVYTMEINENISEALKECDDPSFIREVVEECKKQGRVSIQYDQANLVELSDDDFLCKKKRKNEKPKLCHLLAGEILDVAEERLLDQIFKRRPIFDHFLDIKARHPEKIGKLWLEVHEDVVSFIDSVTTRKIKVDLDVLKNTWLKIKEHYKEFKDLSKKVSGSASKNIQEPKHASKMRAIDAIIQKRTQLSSLSDVKLQVAVGGPSKGIQFTTLHFTYVMFVMLCLLTRRLFICS